MKRILVLLTFVLCVMLSGNLMAQTPVERSSEITKIGSKEYYMHHVKAGQTLYSISIAYNVSVEEIENLNPELKKDGLKTGHVIGIPVRPLPEPKVETPQPEVVQPEPEPEVVQPEPEPEVVQPEPEPVVVEPEPIVVEEKPEPVPEPVVVEPQVVVPEPEPEPVPVVVEPVPEPEPIVEKPVNAQVRNDHRAYFDGKFRIVQPGEDLYDIAKEYGIDIAEFKKLNVGLTDNPVAGTRIQIPAIENDNDYLLHNCERNEKATTLLKRWKVDEKEFRLMNVAVGSHVFVNQVVLIPIDPIRDFYWISGSQEEIAEDVIDTPVEEEVVTVSPVVVPDQDASSDYVFDEEFAAEPECVAAPENARRRYKVALMVPLYLNDVSGLNVSKENLSKAQKARSLSFLQFYEGFMMAVESMERQGMKLDLTVLDVTDNVSTAHTALSQIRGEDYDLIVGPFFSKSFAVVEEYAKNNGIVMVNPLSTRGSVVVDSPNVVKAKPGDVGQIITISNLVKNQYSDANVFILSREKPADSIFLNQLEHHLNLAVNEEVMVSKDEFLQFARNESQRLEMGDRMVATVDVEGQVYSVNDFKSGATQRVTLANQVHRYNYNSDNIRKLKSELSGVRENVIVAYGDDNVFATEILNSLAKETARFPITLIAAPDWAKFEKLLVDNLLQMKAIYISDGFVDYHSEATKDFVMRFRRKYAVEPQSYAFEGYDMGVFFLSGLMRYGDGMLDCLNCCNVPLLHTQYRFFNRNILKSGLDDGRENQYWNLYQYDNETVELVPVDPFKKKEE